MSRLTRSALAFLILASTAAAPTAFAEHGRERVSVRVAYGDLNLAKSAGAQTMLRRLEAASAKACGGRPSPRFIQQWEQHRSCTHQAMSKAVAEIDAPMLNALFSKDSEVKTAAR